jgi:hypothetical protein
MEDTPQIARGKTRRGVLQIHENPQRQISEDWGLALCRMLG